MKAALNPDIHGERRFDCIARLPFALDAVKASRLDVPLLESIDRDTDWIGPCRNAQQQRESDGSLGIHFELDGLAKWIAGHFADLYGNLVHRGSDLAGAIGHDRESAAFRRHPQARNKLRPALMVIGSAAAEVRFEAEQVGIRTVGGPVAFLF